MDPDAQAAEAVTEEQTRLIPSSRGNNGSRPDAAHAPAVARMLDLLARVVEPSKARSPRLSLSPKDRLCGVALGERIRELANLLAATAPLHLITGILSQTRLPVNRMFLDARSSSPPCWIAKRGRIVEVSELTDGPSTVELVPDWTEVRTQQKRTKFEWDALRRSGQVNRRLQWEGEAWWGSHVHRRRETGPLEAAPEVRQKFALLSIALIAAPFSDWTTLAAGSCGRPFVLLVELQQECAVCPQSPQGGEQTGYREGSLMLPGRARHQIYLSSGAGG